MALVSKYKKKTIRLQTLHTVTCSSGMGSIDKEVGVTREHRYSYDDYLNFILTEGPIDHDYEFGTTEEDPRVLALFDLDHLRY